MADTSNALLTRKSFAKRFDERKEERILFVSAPAGYGKTVAVMQWLEKDARSRAILSLDELDNDLPGFCRRFAWALCTCQPGNERLAALVSHDLFSSAPREFALRAIDLLSARKRAVLVIDDLHVLANEKTEQILLIFLKRLPGNIQTVLVSRAEPPPGFSDLWIKGQAARVAAEELLFTKEDVRALCEKRGKPVSEEQAEEIIRLTRGWPIGVNAFLLSGGKLDSDIYEYLDAFIAGNIWDKWEEDVREFMLRTALLHDLFPSLCDALTGREDSGKLLRVLMQSGAFITRAGDGVYRYHQLFQSFLQRMIEPRGEAFRFELLRIQGEWYCGCGDFYSAADCFIRCHDHDGIAKAFDLLQTVRRNSYFIERLLPIALHPEVRAASKEYPFLLYTMGFCAYLDGRIDEMTAYMDEYYARFPEIVARAPAYAHNILYMLFWDYRVKLRDMVSRVDLSLMPPPGDVEGVGGSATLYLPFLHRSSIDLSELAEGGDVLANAGRLSGDIGWLFGKEWVMLGASITAGLLYEKGDLLRAHEYAMAATAAIKGQFASDTKFCALSILAATLDALNDERGADLVMERMSDMIEKDKAYFLSRSFAALTANRKIMGGDLRAARSWLAVHAPEIHEGVTMPGLCEAFITGKACITAGEYSAATILLQKILVMSRLFHRTLDRIEALVLLTVACRKMRGFQAQAARYLEEAVAAAYPYGYTQVFVTYGREITGMLQKLWRRMEQAEGAVEVPTGFVKMLCLSAREARGAGLTSGGESPPVRYTEKQKTVMRLLCEGKTYKEMSGVLGIKLPTLRSHIELIYKKLDVSNEIDAILKIKSTDLLR